jgi:hypothetical protein
VGRSGSTSSSASDNTALGLVLVSLVLIAFFDGCCQGAIFGDAATLPPQYTHVGDAEVHAIASVAGRMGGTSWRVVGQ